MGGWGVAVRKMKAQFIEIIHLKDLINFIHFRTFFLFLTLFNNEKMKKLFLAIALIPLIISCAHKDNSAESRKLVVKEVLDLASNYASEKFKEPKITRETDGTINIIDNQIDFISADRRPLKYVITPGYITIGLINDDRAEDAIITINSFRGDREEVPEHLIMISSDGKLMINRVMEEEMTVLGIKDQVITAEVRSHSRNTPLRDCNACKEVVDFVFKGGDLVRKE